MVLKLKICQMIENNAINNTKLSNINCNDSQYIQTKISVYVPLLYHMNLNQVLFVDYKQFFVYHKLKVNFLLLLSDLFSKTN